MDLKEQSQTVDPEAPLLNVKEAALELEITPKYLRKLIRSGKIPATRDSAKPLSQWSLDKATAIAAYATYKASKAKLSKENAEPGGDPDSSSTEDEDEIHLTLEEKNEILAEIEGASRED